METVVWRVFGRSEMVVFFVEPRFYWVCVWTSSTPAPSMCGPPPHIHPLRVDYMHLHPLRVDYLYTRPFFACRSTTDVGMNSDGLGCMWMEF